MSRQKDREECKWRERVNLQFDILLDDSETCMQPESMAAVPYFAATKLIVRDVKMNLNTVVNIQVWKWRKFSEINMDLLRLMSKINLGKVAYLVYTSPALVYEILDVTDRLCRNAYLDDS